MDRQDFWHLIDQAREGAPDDRAIAERATALLAVRPREDILAFQQLFWDLMSESYREPLWGAAYTINGGCSDDGFDYFRGWLIGQGRATFESAVADPDSLAGNPVVQEAAKDFMELDNESMLGIAYGAYRTAQGEEMPHDAYTIKHSDPGPGWDFDDREETRRHLPRLTALYDVHYAR
ncbi:hypothetical protein GCM10010191_81340 [Actinomadura vinacea]|uniref:DUF4240 domain-containing protein n=1 Tax=Actinomadura vinacea TaxID=115336 RepID=A0ABP5XBN4_9ACTN